MFFSLSTVAYQLKSMSYVALARKYRPKTLSQLQGQSSLVTTLKNAIELNRIYHAFIFTGTRGVGKTTTARIMALSLNCTGTDGNGKETIEPCLQCKNCQDILNFSHPDVIEVDAASHTGVDFAREIVDSSKYPPMSARYKIFIIDEVHMLSKSAFNALLKTLEEPNQFVKFIFATTEFNKIPITIVSRCQKFFLQHLTQDELLVNLENIAKQENIEYERDALMEIAKLARGSVRDSLSIMDQIISLSEDKKITYANISQINDVSGLDDAKNILKLVSEKNITAALEIGEKFLQSGYGIKALLENMIDVISEQSKSYIQNNAIDALEKSDIHYQIITNAIHDASVVNDSSLLNFTILRLVNASNIPSLEKLAQFLIEA